MCLMLNYGTNILFGPKPVPPFLFAVQIPNTFDSIPKKNNRGESNEQKHFPVFSVAMRAVD